MFANPGGLVYGTILVAGLLAAEDAGRETYGETVGAVVLALVSYWIARSYAEFSGTRILNPEPFTLSGLSRVMMRELSMLVGAAVPLLVVLIWWASGGKLTSAVTAAVWTAAGTILTIEAIQGVRSGSSAAPRIAAIALGMILGALVLALRVLLQH